MFLLKANKEKFVKIRKITVFLFLFILLLLLLVTILQGVRKFWPPPLTKKQIWNRLLKIDDQEKYKNIFVSEIIKFLEPLF